MEKITLKPVVKEILHKSSEPGVCFDVSSHHGTDAHQNWLGSLFVLSYLKQKEDDLSYMVSLISSLAKREYFSPQALARPNFAKQNLGGLAEQNPKAAFERTLKKLNEILEEFFKNKQFVLNLGLAAIIGENIFISHLGKLKVALARDNEYIDILSNIQLFNKDTGDEKQFSNIISGRLFPGDKIFAYFPIRAVTSRERLLNPLFVQKDQAEFSEKIAHLAANANNFACCGVHINMRQIKEIPIVPAPSVSVPKFLPTSAVPSAPGDVPSEGRSANTKVTLGPQGSPLRDARVTLAAPLEKEKFVKFGAETPSVMRSEVSVAKRANVFATLVGKLNKLSPIKNFGGFGLTRLARLARQTDGPGGMGSGERGRLRPRVAVAALAVVATIVGWTLFADKDSGQDRAAYDGANENFKLARSHLGQNETKEARRLLQAALGQIVQLDDKKAEILKTEIDKNLDVIDRVSDKQPQLIYNNGAKLPLKKVAVQDGQPAAIDANNKLFAITPDGASELGQFKAAARTVFDVGSYTIVFNGQDALGVYDSKTKKVMLYPLVPPSDAADGAIYENNLYVLAGNTIYKYLDAVTGSTKGNIWGSDSASGNLIAIAADGNIFALTQDGKLIKYFRGKKESETDLQLMPAAGDRIFTDKNSAFIHFASPASKKVYVFDKAGGGLKTAYKFDVAGSIQDFYVSPDGAILALSSEGNIWQTKP